MSFKVVYANGDSFAAGDELGAEKFFPEFSQLFSLNQFPDDPLDPKGIVDFNFLQDMREKWAQKFKMGDPVDLQAECRRLSYSGLLAEKLGIPVVNQAIGGRSTQEAVVTSMTYLETELLKQYQSNEVLVLLGLTQFTRFCVPGDTPWGSKTVSLGINEEPGTEAVKEYFIQHATDRYMANDQIIFLNGFTSYCRQRGITVMLVDSSYYRYSLRHIEPWQANLLPTPDVTMQDLIRSRDEPSKHVFGHYSKEIHVRTASQLYELLEA